jgi:hypothetical protein
MSQLDAIGPRCTRQQGEQHGEQGGNGDPGEQIRVS